MELLIENLMPVVLYTAIVLFTLSNLFEVRRHARNHD